MEASDTTGRPGAEPDEPTGEGSASRQGSASAEGSAGHEGSAVHEGGDGHDGGTPVSDAQRRRFLEALARKQGKGPAGSPAHGEASGGHMGSESAARTQRMFRRKSGG